MSDHDRTILKWRIAALVWVKLATSFIILFYFPSWHAFAIVMLLSVPWLIVGGVYGVRRAPVHYRLWKVRKLRKRLIHEEWHVEEDAPPVESRRRH